MTSAPVLKAEAKIKCRDPILFLRNCLFLSATRKNHQMISLKKSQILTPLQKLPKNKGDLDKLIVAKGFKNVPKSNKLPNLVTLQSSFTFLFSVVSGLPIKIYVYAQNSKGTSEPFIIEETFAKQSKHSVEGNVNNKCLNNC